jgi:hypothetical protein
LKALGFERDYILYQMPCIEGWMWLAESQENGDWPVELACDGYLAQEITRRRASRQAAKPRRKKRN